MFEVNVKNMMEENVTEEETNIQVCINSMTNL